MFDPKLKVISESYLSVEDGMSQNKLDLINYLLRDLDYVSDPKLKVIREILEDLTDIGPEHLPLLQGLEQRLRSVGQRGGAAGENSDQYAIAVEHLEERITEISQVAPSEDGSRTPSGGPR